MKKFILLLCIIMSFIIIVPVDIQGNAEFYMSFSKDTRDKLLFAKRNKCTVVINGSYSCLEVNDIMNTLPELADTKWQVTPTGKHYVYTFLESNVSKNRLDIEQRLARIEDQLKTLIEMLDKRGL
jgi:hypothetical protein